MADEAAMRDAFAAGHGQPPGSAMFVPLHMVTEWYGLQYHPHVTNQASNLPNQVSSATGAGGGAGGGAAPSDEVVTALARAYDMSVEAVRGWSAADIEEAYSSLSPGVGQATGEHDDDHDYGDGAEYDYDAGGECGHDDATGGMGMVEGSALLAIEAVEQHHYSNVGNIFMGALAGGGASASAASGPSSIDVSGPDDTASLADIFSIEEITLAKKRQHEMDEHNANGPGGSDSGVSSKPKKAAGDATVGGDDDDDDSSWADPEAGLSFGDSLGLAPGKPRAALDTPYNAHALFKAYQAGVGSGGYRSQDVPTEAEIVSRYGTKNGQFFIHDAFTLNYLVEIGRANAVDRCAGKTVCVGHGADKEALRRARVAYHAAKSSRKGSGADGGGGDGGSSSTGGGDDGGGGGGGGGGSRSTAIGGEGGGYDDDEEEEEEDDGQWQDNGEMLSDDFGVPMTTEQRMEMMKEVAKVEQEQKDQRAQMQKRLKEDPEDAKAKLWKMLTEQHPDIPITIR